MASQLPKTLSPTTKHCTFYTPSITKPLSTDSHPQLSTPISMNCMGLIPNHLISCTDCLFTTDLALETKMEGVMR